MLKVLFQLFQCIPSDLTEKNFSIRSFSHLPAATVEDNAHLKILFSMYLLKEICHTWDLETQNWRLFLSELWLKSGS